MERSRPEILMGYKRAIIVLSEGIPIADLIFQPHKQLPQIIELKNLRVAREARGRGLARFMLKQPEIELPGRDGIIGDLHTDQLEVRQTLDSLGYRRIAVVSLYDPNTEDEVWIKTLDRDNELSTIYRSQELVLANRI